MKHLFTILLSCLSLHVSHGQSVDYSYVRSRTMTNVGGTAWLDHYDYDNGLGQLYQQVDVGITPNQYSLVTLHEYDDQRRPWRTWLPTPMSGSGVQGDTAVRTTAQTAHQDARPFTESVYEQSPIEWKSDEYRPGNAWYQAGKKASFSRYACGSSAMEGGLIHLPYFLGGMAHLDEPYTDCMVEEADDEDGLRTLTLKDREGRVCAVRRISQGDNLTTYYVYDDFGDLRFVLPPESATHFEYAGDVSPTDGYLLKYGYEYRYDDRHNCIYKRLPGCDPVYYVYDRAGRCIFSQDGVQRAKGQWTYSIPDIFGRVLITGVCHNSLSYTSEPLRNVTVTATRDNADNSYYGHTVSGVSLVSDTLVTATFYDDYSFIGHNGLAATLNYAAPPSSDYGSQGLTAPKGLQTGSVMARLTNGNITSYDAIVQYYDDRGRVVQTKSRHFAEGYATEWMGYDFLGHVTRRMHTHSISGLPDQTEVYAMTYDHAGRLTQTTHQVNSSSAVTLCSNTYNELCQLASSTQGNSLSTTYGYNVRSWPKTITTGTLFSETLYYNESYGGNTPRYNGNISAMAWKADAKNRAFRYAYDSFGRLSSAVYLEEGVANQHYDEAFTYDKMGNVQSIVRYGLQDNSQYGLIDNVSLYYNGNQVVHADDAVTGPNYAGAFHFRDGSGTQPDTEYTYDKNGNLTKDFNKNISSIQYNLLNLPSKTTFGDGGYINYQYSASGMKQMVSGYAPGQGYKSQFYLGSYVYSSGTVKQLLVDGGYVTFSGTTPQYHFYVKDHLGNNRMVVNASGTVEQVSHYYAFGGLMGENTGSDVQDFKYNGKELDRLHGLDWYDYSARHMDAARGVFTTMDPLAEKYYDISPYAYCGNNPVLFIDPTGMEPDSLESALMAAYSYHDSKRSSYAKQLRDRGWKVVNNFKSKTGFKATLFSKTTEMDGDMQSEYAFAFAGTDFKINSLNGMLDAAKDIAADIQNYLGVGLSLQQAQAAVCALAFSLKYDNLTFVGHSLGGGLAAFASMITGNAAITFNPASLNGTAKQIGNLFGGEGNITQYRTVGNPLFNSPIRVGGDYINQFQSITGHPSQGNVHPVYINSHNFNHNIETFVTLFGGQ